MGGTTTGSTDGCNIRGCYFYQGCFLAQPQHGTPTPFLLAKPGSKFLPVDSSRGLVAPGTLIEFFRVFSNDGLGG